MDVIVTILAFKHHLKALGYATSTIEGYRKGLDQFRRYLVDRDIRDLRRVSHGVILDYQASVMNESIAMESKALKLRPVKRLFEHLVTTHKLLVNPTDGIVETCRRNRRIGPVLTLAEVKRLMDQANLSTRTGIRDRAIMEVLYATGIRLNELLTVEVYHVDLADNVLYIRKGKGRKQRVVPLGKTATTWLREYMEKIRGYYARKRPKQRRLFLLNTGDAMTPAGLRSNLRKYRIQANIPKPVSPHTFRRTCATHLLQNGADIRYIQKLLGHRRLSTTRTYTKIMPIEVKKIHEKTHPGVKTGKEGREDNDD